MTLEMINERFVVTRISLFNLLRRNADVKALRWRSDSQVWRIYPHLYVPTSLNLVKARPPEAQAYSFWMPNWSSSWWITFGGDGRHAKIEGREFTPTEIRIVQMVLETGFVDMKEAWNAVMKLTSNMSVLRSILP